MRRGDRYLSSGDVDPSVAMEEKNKREKMKEGLRGKLLFPFWPTATFPNRSQTEFFSLVGIAYRL